MTLFVAEPEQGGLQAATAQRFAASVVHLDEAQNIVWLWVPALTASLIELNQDSLFVWNEGLAGATQPQRFAKLDLGCHYKGLVCLAVDQLTLSAQRSTLNVPDIKPATWPDLCGALQQVLDAIDVAVPGETLQMLKAIAIYATSQNVSFGSQMSLQGWLALTVVPTAKKDLAIHSVFVDAAGQRPSLFAELERLVVERRMVILLGSKQSGLKEFLMGFQNNIEHSPATRFAYVTARFNSEHFRQIYDVWKNPLDLPELDCLFAALAFGAVNGLRNKTGSFLPNFLTAKMIDKPLVFAKPYLLNATQHEDQWQCIRHFLQFLRNAAEEAGIVGKITIFLPFEEVEEVINGNDEARRQLWQGLGALRDQLRTEPDHCPQLGLVLAVPEIAIDQMTEPQFVRQVLTIPPLSREELGRLLESFWGSPADTKELDSLENYSGGDPWFVYLLFRCLKSVTETRSQTTNSTRGESAILEACNLALRAVSGDGQEDLQKSVPEVRAACEIYVAECSEILRQYQGELGTRKVLTAWEHPEGYYHAQRRKMDKSELAWILTGLVYTQARGATRVDSLESLHEYPVYQFCQAGKLPLAFAERVLTVARGQ